MGSIADALRRWRHERWLTQAQAAELLQVSLTTYHRWERGRTVPSYRDLQSLRARIGDWSFAPGAPVRPGGGR